MPTYDYECRKCGHRFEVFHSMSDETEHRCPKCRSKARRVPSAGAGLLFKGSGFYITDYRSKSYQESERADQSASKDAKGSEAAGATPTGDSSAAGTSGSGGGGEAGVSGAAGSTSGKPGSTAPSTSATPPTAKGGGAKERSKEGKRSRSKSDRRGSGS